MELATASNAKMFSCSANDDDKTAATNYFKTLSKWQPFICIFLYSLIDFFHLLLLVNNSVTPIISIIIFIIYIIVCCVSVCVFVAKTTLLVLHEFTPLNRKQVLFSLFLFLFISCCLLMVMVFTFLFYELRDTSILCL